MWATIICAGIAVLFVSPYLLASIVWFVSGRQSEAVFLLGTMIPLAGGIFLVLRFLVFLFVWLF